MVFLVREAAMVVAIEVVVDGMEVIVMVSQFARFAKGWSFSLCLLFSL